MFFFFYFGSFRPFFCSSPFFFFCPHPLLPPSVHAFYLFQWALLKPVASLNLWVFSPAGNECCFWHGHPNTAPHKLTKLASIAQNPCPAENFCWIHPVPACCVHGWKCHWRLYCDVKVHATQRSVFVNIDPLEHSHAHLFSTVFGCFHTMMTLG